MSEKKLPGNAEMRVGPVTLACMAAEARDLMEQALDGWRDFAKGLPRSPEDPAYSFAYWLFCWSGLIDPAAQGRVKELHERQRWLDAIDSGEKGEMLLAWEGMDEGGRRRLMGLYLAFACGMSARLREVQEAHRAEVEGLRAKLEAAVNRIGAQSEIITNLAERGGFKPALLRARREAARMTQAAMADRLGVTRNAIVNWEAGKTRPDADELWRLGELLGCPAAAFFGTAEGRT